MTEHPNEQDYANKAEREAAYRREHGLLVSLAPGGKGYALCFADGEILPGLTRCVVDANATGATVTATFECIGSDIKFAGAEAFDQPQGEAA